MMAINGTLASAPACSRMSCRGAKLRVEWLLKAYRDFFLLLSNGRPLPIVDVNRTGERRRGQRELLAVKGQVAEAESADLIDFAYCRFLPPRLDLSPPRALG